MTKPAVWQLCLLACFSTALLLGQQVTGNGTVTGKVTDPSGAAVPEATVTLIDESTNIPITLQSNSAGLYVLQRRSVREVRPQRHKSGLPEEHSYCPTGGHRNAAYFECFPRGWRDQ